MSATADHLERFLERLRLLDNPQRWPGSSHIEPALSPLYLPVIDPLTRLPNRRAIVGLAEREFHRRQSPLALVLFDVDDFRAVNKRYLLSAGDAVLRQMSELLAAVVVNEFVGGFVVQSGATTAAELQSHYRDDDHRHEFVGRFGGDCFIVIASNTTHDQAVSLMERLAKAIREATFTHRDDRIKITASFGMAVAEPGVSSVQAELLAPEEGGVPAGLQPFVRLATDRMDEAKRKRRDRRSGLQ